MATKKLKLEVELDTAKAKRQKKELEAESPSSGASVSIRTDSRQTSGFSESSKASEKLAGSLDRASRSVSKLGDEAGSSARNMTGLVKSFAGMAVGLSATYAAGYMKPGKARDAVEYAGSAITGASTGAAVGKMAGPYGTAAGAVIGVAAGLAKTAMEKKAESEKAIKDFTEGEDRYQDNRLWQDKIRKLTDVDPSPVGMSKKDANEDQVEKVDERLAKAKKEAVSLFEEENRILARIKGHLEKGETAQAEELGEQLQIVRARKEQMEALERGFESQKKTLAREKQQIELDEKKDEEKKKRKIRTSTSGTDSLAKVGGTAYVTDPYGSARQETSRKDTASSPVRAAGFSFGFSVASQRAATMSFSQDRRDSLDRAIETADERQARRDEQMQKALDEIAKNTKGGDTWQ